MPRPDGRRIKTLPPFCKIIPFIMTSRVDATNYMSADFPYEKIADYISARKSMGDNSVSLMSCLIAAYVRTVASFPEINRFVVAKKIYARKDIWVSFVTLKGSWSGDGEQEETVVKLIFDGTETIGEISKMVNDIIDNNRAPGEGNAMDKLLAGIFRIPILPSLITSTLKGLDHIGLLPLSVVKVSPFHTSLFVSNMASIRSYPVYHHCYNWGTTSTFLALGYDRNDPKKYVIKVAADERICSGSTMVRAMHLFMRLLRHIDQLESPPDHVKPDMR